MLARRKVRVIKLGIIVCTLGTRASLADLAQSLVDLPEGCVVTVVSPLANRQDFKSYVINLTKNTRLNFVLDQGAGIYEAFNVGVKNTKSEWIIFLNDDDELLPESLLELLSFLERISADLVMCNYISNGVNEKKISSHSLMADYEYWAKKGRMSTSHQGQVWRRKKIVEEGYFSLKSELKFFGLRIKFFYFICSDFDLYLRSISSGLRIEFNSLCIAKVGHGGLSSKRLYRRAFETVLSLVQHKYLNSYRAFLLLFRLWGQFFLGINRT